MPAGTVCLHRVLRATPERTYRAFIDPDARVTWLPPNGFTAKVQQMLLGLARTAHVTRQVSRS